MKEDRLSVHIAVWLVATLAAFLVLVGVPSPASAADSDPSFDQFPQSFTFIANASTTINADAKITIGKPGWDSRLMPLSTGGTSQWSYGYVYPIKAEFTRPTTQNRLPSFSTRSYKPDGAPNGSGSGGTMTQAQMQQYTVPQPWPAVCDGYDYCISANLKVGGHDYVNSQYNGPGWAYQFYGWYLSGHTTTGPTEIGPTRLPVAVSTESPPTGLPVVTEPVEPEPEPEPEDTGACFPEGWSWDVGAMLGEAVECLFVPDDDFMGDLTEGLDNIGPDKFPVVLNNTVSDWEFVGIHGCKGITLDLSGVVPDVRPVNLLNACGMGWNECGGQVGGDWGNDAIAGCRNTAIAMENGAALARTVISISVIIGAFFAVRRAVGATVQYNTGGE